MLQQKSAVQRIVSKYSNRLETRRSLIANRLKASIKNLVDFSFSSLPLQYIYMDFLSCKGVRVWFFVQKKWSGTLVFSSRTNYLFFCYKRNTIIIVYMHIYEYKQNNHHIYTIYMKYTDIIY